MRIGNRADAMAIHAHAHDYGCAMPDGFTELSGGSCRSVYTKDDVVYKVQTSFEGYMRGYGNRTEYMHARRLRAQSDNGWIGRVYIPATTGYRFSGTDIVVAMEFIEGERGSFSQSNMSGVTADALWQLFNLGFGDMHGRNYVWMKGRKTAVSPIDMGSRRWSDPLNKADRRCIQGTPYYRKVDLHHDFMWKNRERLPHLPPSCPCGCGVVRWAP